MKKGILLLLLTLMFSQCFAIQKGIYVTQSSLENTAFITTLIQQAKAAGINTFVIDLNRPSARYRTNIKKVLDAHLKYVVRLVVFPHGGTAAQVRNPAFWQRKWPFAEAAINMGASAVQLDYIRYNTRTPSRASNSHDIEKIIRWYRQRVNARGIPLEIDVFGITIFQPSHRIGQNLHVIADDTDVICPMVYPSHFEPFRKYSQMPFFTIYNSVKTLKAKFHDKAGFKIIPYIEVSNYRYPMSLTTRLDYIHKQILGAEKAGADGWYFWSPHNKYGALFTVMRR
ncbi:MAG: putative glycoside hydrolase [Gammaproteobacteria bacterium]